MLHIPLRHALYLLSSCIFLILGYLLLYWTDGFGPLSAVCFLGGVVATVLFGIVSHERWAAGIWPVLFLLLGLIVRHDLLLAVDLLIGLAFSLLFLSIGRRAFPFINFYFFPIVKPSLRIFLIVIILALALGIYGGVPPQTIEQKIQNGIAKVEDLHLPGGEKFSLSNLVGGTKFSEILAKSLEASRQKVLNEGFISSIIDRVAEKRITEECGGDQESECAERVRIEIRESFLRENESLGEIPEMTSEDPEDTDKEFIAFLQEQISKFSGQNNLSLVTAGTFFLILLPFTGLFAWILSLIPYLFFLFFRRVGILEMRERTVTQKFFV